MRQNGQTPEGVYAALGGGGAVQREDFCRLLLAVNPEMSELDQSALWEFADENEDGTLSAEEFCALFATENLSEEDESPFDEIEKASSGAAAVGERCDSRQDNSSDEVRNVVLVQLMCWSFLPVAQRLCLTMAGVFLFTRTCR